MTCRGIRQGDQYACAKCVLTWDVGEESPCPVQVDIEPGAINYVDENGKQLTVDKLPPAYELKDDPITFMQFAVHMGYELKPYHRQLLEMLDKQINGRT